MNLTYFTVEQLQAIYEANCVHEGTRYVMGPRPGIHDAHLNGLKAVALALEDKFEDVRADCCDSTMRHYERD